MNAKALIPLIAGLGIGGLALKMGFDTLKNARGTQKPVDAVQVWGAARDILRGDVVTEDMLKPITFPSNLLPSGAVSEKDEIIGRVCEIDTPTSMIILDHTLLPPGETRRLRVKPGFRAVSVKIDEGSGVDFHLEPGCFVDVVGSFNVRGDGGKVETVASTLLENVEVAAVGERISPATAKEDEGKRPEKRKVRAVTLFVKPEQVAKLHVTEQKGRIKLALRSDDDGGTIRNGQWVSELELSGQRRQAPPPPSEPAGDPFDASALAMLMTPSEPAQQNWVVGIYRGSAAKKEEVVFSDKNAIEPLTPTSDASAPWPLSPPTPNMFGNQPTGTPGATQSNAPGGGSLVDSFSSLLGQLGGSQSQTAQNATPATDEMSQEGPVDQQEDPYEEEPSE